MKKKYEAIFIYDQQDAVFKSSIEKTKAIFSGYGVDITSEEDMGKKKLAYEVKKKKEGHYYLYHIKVDGSKIAQIEKDLRLDEDILRHLFVRIDYLQPRRFKASQ